MDPSFDIEGSTSSMLWMCGRRITIFRQVYHVKIRTVNQGPRDPFLSQRNSTMGKELRAKSHKNKTPTLDNTALAFHSKLMGLSGRVIPTMLLMGHYWSTSTQLHSKNSKMGP